MAEPQMTKSQRVLITGGASGIGRAMAEAFLDAGARVHVADLAEARGGEPDGCSFTGVDVSDPAGVDELFDAVRAPIDAGGLGGLDVLCNVAGVPHDGQLEDLSDADFDRVVAINIKGTLYGCQAAIPAMAARGGGSIINVSSGDGELVYLNSALQAATSPHEP